MKMVTLNFAILALVLLSEEQKEKRALREAPNTLRLR
jgi:hypothetical protein